MFVKIRGPDCKKIEIVPITLLMLVEELKQKVAELFDVEPPSQRLIYRGKQLEDGYKLFDYGVQRNEVLQLIVKQNIVKKEEEKTIDEPLSIEKRLNSLPQISESKHYKVGEYVDFLDIVFGAWFQGRIKNIHVENQTKLDAIGETVGSPAENGISSPTRNGVDSPAGKAADSPAGKAVASPAAKGLSSPVGKSVSSPHSKQTTPKNKFGGDIAKYFIRTTPNSANGNVSKQIPVIEIQALESDTTENVFSSKSDSDEGTSEMESGEASGQSSEPHSKASGINGVENEIKNSSGESSNDPTGSPKENGRVDTRDEGSALDDGCLYVIANVNHVDELEMVCKLSEIRPISRELLKLPDLKVGQTVLVNYNDGEPEKLGHWFDFTISKITNERTKKWLRGELRIHDKSGCKLSNVNIKNLEMIWKIEELSLLKERHCFPDLTTVQKRPVPPLCDKCNDNPRKKCKSCSCQVCGQKNDPSKQIMCDECDSPFHLWCLTPPLEEIPDVDEWFCPDCKIDENEIVKAGDKLKASKKKENLQSKKSGSTKWGKGMANVGLTKRCTLVPPHHFGPIPGVEVGSCWRFRIQASEAGVHRPPVGGMHGREDVGAFSIVLSGGYEDDEDFGDSFWYTGAGGRDLSGNKRTSVQSCDQLLTNTNKALALNCNAPLSEEGAKSADWKKGKPVRVVRSYKFRKHSKYAPEEGLRYDGIYKVVEYRPEKGQSGFKVWRYFLRRDDETPAPWTAEGQKRIKALGLQLEVPENYDVALSKRKQEQNSKNSGKRKNDEPELNALTKKIKAEPYVIESKIIQLIAKDKQNAKLWETCSMSLNEGKKKYLESVTETFSCICCQELLFQPITTPCIHNFCLDCMQRAFKAEVYTCPACRNDLTKDYKFKVNENLFNVLKAFFPGYEVGRK